MLAIQPVGFTIYRQYCRTVGAHIRSVLSTRAPRVGCMHALQRMLPFAINHSGCCRRGEMRRKLLFPLYVFCIAGSLSAQPWSGIIDSRRAVDWSTAGVTGGIPNRTTICSTLSPGVSSAQINSALASCPAGQVVLLNAGTYNLSSGINLKSNVTLRGAGANRTILNFTGTSSYYWGSYFVGALGNYSGGFENSAPGPGGADPSRLRSWTGTNGANG